MRISDWSSDVCSSDLHDAVAAGEVARAPLRRYTHVLPQLAGVAQSIARGLVQIAHLGIGVGEDDPGLVRIGAALRVPCVDQLGPRSLARLGDRTSVVWGKSVAVRVDIGGYRHIKKKKI